MLAGNARQMLLLRVTAIKLLTTAAMVDNLAEKVNECQLNQVAKYCLCTIGTMKADPYIWSSGVSTIQGLLKY